MNDYKFDIDNFDFDIDNYKLDTDDCNFDIDNCNFDTGDCNYDISNCKFDTGDCKFGINDCNLRKAIIFIIFVIVVIIPGCAKITFIPFITKIIVQTMRTALHQLVQQSFNYRLPGCKCGYFEEGGQLRGYLLQKSTAAEFFPEFLVQLYFICF